MADTKPSAFTTDATPDDADIIPYVDLDGGGAGVHLNRKLTFADLKAALGLGTTKVVGTNQSNTTVTPAAVTDLSGSSLAPGTYRIRADIVWQSAATTTGISLYFRGAGGTVTRSVGHVYTTTTGGAATTGIADQDATGNQMLESHAWRANNVDPGPMAGVDTINADQLSIIEGTLVVTATTTLDVMFRSEVAASGVTVMAGSNVTYTKIA